MTTIYIYTGHVSYASLKGSIKVLRVKEIESRRSWLTTVEGDGRIQLYGTEVYNIWLGGESPNAVKILALIYYRTKDATLYRSLPDLKPPSENDETLEDNDSWRLLAHVPPLKR